MVRTLVWAALLLALSIPYCHAKTVRFDMGGYVEEYRAMWTKVARSGEQVRIDGPCVSACTMVLSIVPAERICITRRAVFGIHQVSIGDKKYLKGTRQMVREYPKWVQQWLKGKRPLHYEPVWLYPKDIGKNLRRCK